MTAPVFLAPTVLKDGGEEPLSKVRDGDLIAFAGPEARHAARSMRLQDGEVLDLVDGSGWRVEGTVASAPGAQGADTLMVRVDRVGEEPTLTPSLILVQALAKGGDDEQAIRTATELGVDAVLPWQADRSIVRWSPEKAGKGLRKWQEALEAATKQSRRSKVPELHTPLKSPGLTQQIRSWTQDGADVFVCHEEAQERLSQAVSPDATNVVVIVGPEGGISERELAEFQDAGAQIVGLGPHVMRSANAGAAALVVANVALERW